jgi:type III pantothenate kinase
MLLAIDIGNTNITLGLYRDQEVAFAWRLATANDRMPDEYGLQLLGLLQHAGCAPSVIEAIVLASVVPPLTGTFLQACRKYLDRTPFVVDAGVKTGVRIRYAAAVQHFYGGPACIVDFGTATTFDAISREGDYLGGAIAPGIGIASEALFQRTAKLPRVDLARPPGAIGRNTVTAIQSGLVFGYVGLVEGMVARFRAELGQDMHVIGTGGLADLIAPETDVIQHLAPWLTLDGLRIIWELNHPS